MRNRFKPCVLVAGLLVAAGAHFQSDLKKALKDTEVAPHWIYDDIPKAFAQAKATGKPLLVVFRCVP
ncbi:MAG: hypothetical protein HY000_11580 [Planctomycetes bacterium]|nr:hypothetical protein [Planctomycetota bacterium]